jgi:hypothetical protein
LYTYVIYLWYAFRESIQVIICEPLNVPL